MNDLCIYEPTKSDGHITVYYKNNKMLNEHGVSFHWWNAASTSLHSHDFCEIFIITHGEALHELNGEKIRLEKGTVQFIKPQDVHIIKACERLGCVHMNLCVKTDKLRQIFAALNIDEEKFFSQSAMKTVLSAEELDFFVKKAEKINLMKFEGEADFTVAVCELVVHAILTVYGTKNAIKSDYPEWFADVLEKIHSPEFFGCTASDVYTLGNFSAPAMISHFRKYTGKTVSEYLKEVRIKNAKSLLKNTELSIIEISNLLGYASLSHFNKMFKECTGVTPAVYRRKCKHY